jgi:ribosomal protein S18 acetylase RimI-like enzyme
MIALPPHEAPDAPDAPQIRPMTAADVPAASAASAAAFDIDIVDEPGRRSWEKRVAYSLQTDPGGAFVARIGDRVVGVVQAVVRERLWCLSLLAVDPGAQSRSAGRLLLHRALAYGADVDAGIIISSNDPRALRLYAAAGFRMVPTFDAEGPLDRRALPPTDPAIAGAGEDDLDDLAEISRALRGAEHTAELRFGLSRGVRIVRHGDRGFAVLDFGRVWLLAARDEEAASALLWHVLELAGADGDRTPSVRWITGEQQWAIDVVLRAGMRLSANGAIGIRGRPGPLAPYLPSPPFG